MSDGLRGAAAGDPVDRCRRSCFGRGRGFAPWQQVLTGGWDVCLDFTGNDRSALATVLSRARSARRPSTGCAASRSCARWPTTASSSRRCASGTPSITTSISSGAIGADRAADATRRRSCASRSRRSAAAERCVTRRIAGRSRCSIPARRGRRNTGCRSAGRRSRAHLRERARAGVACSPAGAMRSSARHRSRGSTSRSASRDDRRDLAAQIDPADLLRAALIAQRAARA